MSEETIKWIMLGSIAAFVCVMGGYLLVMTGRLREERRAQKAEFVETVMQGLLNSSIKSYDDIYNVFSAIRSIRTSSGKQSWILIPWIQSVILSIYKQQSTDKKETALSASLEFLKQTIVELEREEPFSDLPTTERNLMSDILAFGLKNDEAIFVHKLQDLSGVIKARYEENAKLRKTTKWWTQISIASVLLAVASIVIGIWNPFGGE